MKEITVGAKIESVETVTNFINEVLEEYDCPMKAQIQIDVAIDEILSNIAYYAYDDSGGDATVEIDYAEDSGSVILRFIDSGKEYNPLNAKEPDVTLGADERQIGGLGIFMVKKSMDDMTYEYKNGKNILSLRKAIGV